MFQRWLLFQVLGPGISALECQGIHPSAHHWQVFDRFKYVYSTEQTEVIKIHFRGKFQKCRKMESGTPILCHSLSLPLEGVGWWSGAADSGFRGCRSPLRTSAEQGSLETAQQSSVAEGQLRGYLCTCMPECVQVRVTCSCACR